MASRTPTSVTRSSTNPLAPPPLTLGRAVALAWHLAALFVFTYALRRLPDLANISGINIEEQFGTHYQFLTNLGLWFSRLTMLFAISTDFAPAADAGVGRIKTVLSALTMPAEILISLLYWPILLFDPTLLIPPRKVFHPDNPAQFIWETVRLPLLDDLCFHAAPAFFLLIDYLIFSPPFQRRSRPALLAALSTGGYAVWVEICHSKNGTYPYPLLGVLSDVQRAGLYSVCALIFVAITLSATALHKVVDAALGRTWDAVGGTPGAGTVGAVDKATTAANKKAKKAK